MQVVLRKPDAQEQKRKAVCIEQMTQDRQQLWVRWPFIGSIIMRMELVAVRDDRLDTACTDGSKIFVDINFYAKLNRSERLFVLAHEVWHSVLLHFARRQNRDQDLFNQAADLEIHFVLKGEKMTEPWVLPHEETWDGLAAEEIYERLKQKFPAAVSDDAPSGNQGKGSGNSGKQKKDSGKEKPAAQFDKHIYSGDEIETPQEAACEAGGTPEITVDEEYAPLITDDAAEQIRGKVVSAIQQIERKQGKLPANLAALVGRLLKPELPWQELLKQFVSSCYGGKRRWLPPSRRHVWQDLYLPSMRSEVLRAAVALDTSGSTQNDMSRFFGELLALMKSFGKFELTVIQCDADVQKVEQFSDAALPGEEHKWEMHGGGGTDFRPVFRYFEKQKTKPELLIYFTDGYGTAPEHKPPYPVMWVFTKDHQLPCDWGRKVFFKG